MNVLKILFLLIGAIYLLIPSDLLPDFLVGFGWIDDLIVIGLLWWYYRRFSQSQRSGNDPNQGRAAEEGGYRETTSQRKGPADPYLVLELSPGATRQEIKSAYRRLAAQYHPDKVQHLGKDIQAVAEARFREIQQAYDALVSK